MFVRKLFKSFIFVVCFTIAALSGAQEATVDLNSASAEELASALQGIGLKKAEAIVNYRESVGEFTEIDQLVNVKGVGPVILDKNRHILVISDTTNQ